MDHHLLHLLPSLFAFILFCLDILAEGTEKKFFGKAKETAAYNIQIELLEEAKIEVSEDDKLKIIQALQKWDFRCFRTAILGMSQLQFLELMMIQCLLFFLICHQESSAVFIPVLLGTAFLLLYVATFFEHENFTWFNSKTEKNNDSSTAHYYRSLLARLTIIVVCASFLYFSERVTEILFLAANRCGLYMLFISLTVFAALITMYIVKKRDANGYYDE